MSALLLSCSICLLSCFSCFSHQHLNAFAAHSQTASPHHNSSFFHFSHLYFLLSLSFLLHFSFFHTNSETNLKTFVAHPDTNHINTPQLASQLKVILTCQAPNANLNVFEGVWQWADQPASSANQNKPAVGQVATVPHFVRQPSTRNPNAIHSPDEEKEKKEKEAAAAAAAAPPASARADRSREIPLTKSQLLLRVSHPTEGSAVCFFFTIVFIFLFGVSWISCVQIGH